MRQPVELRPCPFCGRPARLVEVDERMWSLVCDHDERCALDGVGIEDIPIDGDEERDLWVYAWDRRVK